MACVASVTYRRAALTFPEIIRADVRDSRRRPRASVTATYRRGRALVCCQPFFTPGATPASQRCDRRHDRGRPASSRLLACPFCLCSSADDAARGRAAWPLLGGASGGVRRGSDRRLGDQTARPLADRALRRCPGLEPRREGCCAAKRRRWCLCTSRPPPRPPAPLPIPRRARPPAVAVCATPAPRRPAARRAAPPSPDAWRVCCESLGRLATAFLAGWGGGGVAPAPAQRQRAAPRGGAAPPPPRRRAAPPANPPAGGRISRSRGCLVAVGARRGSGGEPPPRHGQRPVLFLLSLPYWLFLAVPGGSCLCVWWRERLGCARTGG